MVVKSGWLSILTIVLTSASTSPPACPLGHRDQCKSVHGCEYCPSNHSEGTWWVPLKTSAGNYPYMTTYKQMLCKWLHIHVKVPFVTPAVQSSWSWIGPHPSFSASQKYRLPHNIHYSGGLVLLICCFHTSYLVLSAAPSHFQGTPLCFIFPHFPWVTCWRSATLSASLFNCCAWVTTFSWLPIQARIRPGMTAFILLMLHMQLISGRRASLHDLALAIGVDSNWSTSQDWLSAHNTPWIFSCSGDGTTLAIIL